MAILPKLLPISPLFLIFLLSIAAQTSLSSRPLLPTNPSPDIHDFLPLFGLPKGLLPKAVKAYSLSSDNSFTVELQRPCYIQFDELVYYEKTIRGRLGYGSVSDVSGIQAKKIFVWVGVTSIKVDSGSRMIEFHAGAFSEKLPLSQFETVRDCKKTRCQGQPRSELQSY